MASLLVEDELKTTYDPLKKDVPKIPDIYSAPHKRTRGYLKHVKGGGE